MINDFARGWALAVDEGPEWLFFRLSKTSGDAAPEPPVAKTIWDHAHHVSRKRLVFELEEGILLTSFLVGQLVLLHKRAEIEGGVFRLCQIAEHSYCTLRGMKMADRFPNYRSREDAVLGRLPAS